MAFTRNRMRLGAAVIAGVLLAACSADRTAGPTQRSLAPGQALLDQSTMDEYGYIYACKKDGPAGTYTFNLSMQNGGFFQNVAGPNATVNFNGVDMVCALMGYVDQPDTWIGKTATITVTETNLPPGMVVDSIEVYNSNVVGALPTVKGTATVTRQFVFGDRMWFKYYNRQTPPPPPPTTANCVAITAVQGVALTPVTLTGSGGHGGPYTFSATGLPNGITISSGGTISGTSTVTGTFNYTVTVTDNDGHSGSVNCSLKVDPPPPPPPGGEGCTPGYWKARPHHDSWAATGYTTGQLLSTVFTFPAGYTVNGSAMGGYTMLQGLSFQGGSSVSEKAEILIRAAVAAVLNAGIGLSYPMTGAQIISAVNAALASGDADTILALATKLDGYNNAGCTLN